MLTLPDDRAPTGLPDPGIEALAHTKIASTISTVVADGYAVVLSTADIANSLLANAIGYPIAASVALVTPAAGANSSCWPADPSQHHIAHQQPVDLEGRYSTRGKADQQ